MAEFVYNVRCGDIMVTRGAKTVFVDDVKAGRFLVSLDDRSDTSPMVKSVIDAPGKTLEFFRDQYAELGAKKFVDKYSKIARDAASDCDIKPGPAALKSKDSEYVYFSTFGGGSMHVAIGGSGVSLDKGQEKNSAAIFFNDGKGGKLSHVVPVDLGKPFRVWDYHDEYLEKGAEKFVARYMRFGRKMLEYYS